MRPFSLLTLLALAASSALAVSPLVDPTRAFPATAATNVPIDAPLRMSFPEAFQLAGKGKIEIHDADGGAVVDTIDTSAKTVDRMIGGINYHCFPVVIDGKEAYAFPKPGALAYGKTYYVTVDAGVFTSPDGFNSAVAQPQAWRFSTRKTAPPAGKTKIVVAADGTGDFCTVQSAIDYVPENSSRRIVLELKRGTYREMVRVPMNKNKITLHGEDRHKSIIAYTDNARVNGRSRGMFEVMGADFVLQNLTLHNTTEKDGSQAETLLVRQSADRFAVDHCDFSSLQDTLQITGRAYLADCFVEGDVDFVWGSGTVFFENCELKALNPGYLVQSRNNATHLGYIFDNCRLTAAPGVERYILARIEPTRWPASHVAFIHCVMGPHIAPVGWQFDTVKPSDRPPVPPEKVHGPTDQIRFEEFENTTPEGKPVDVSQRIAPARQLTPEEAAKETDVLQVLGGTDQWDPRAAIAHATTP